MVKNIKNVFISHYGKDDEQIFNLKDLLAKNGYELRNSSIDSTKSNEASNSDYIRRLLRDGIQWAGTTIVLIGPKTHTREWVDWEIKESQLQGNRIVGIYIQDATDANIPENLAKYGDALVGWQSDRIIDAIEGQYNNMEKPNGSPWENPYNPNRSNC